MILKLLEMMGRKYVMLTPRGQVIVEKYVLLGSRRSKFWRGMPSASLHRWCHLGRDQFRHNHIADFASFILKGGYFERRDSGVWFRGRFTWNVLKHDQFHDIRATLPGTWTLFFMGFRRGKVFVERGGKPKESKDVWLQVTPELAARIERLKNRNEG